MYVCMYVCMYIYIYIYIYIYESFPPSLSTQAVHSVTHIRYPKYDDNVWSKLSVPGAEKLQKLLSVRP